MTKTKTSLLRIAAIAAAVALLGQVHADEIKSINVPAGDLTVALETLASQSGVELLYRPEQLKGLYTKGVQGASSSEEAARKLVEGTALRVRSGPSGLLLISSDAPSQTSADRLATHIRLAQSDSLQNTNSHSSASASSSDDAEDRSMRLDEIVVTAQKRAQNLQNIPISISAIGGQRIEELGLQNLNDLMGQVPGVSFTSVGPGEGNLVMRGIATGDIVGNVNNRKEAVGVYLNDTPVGQVRYNPDISPFDLERVEVLRGPQGTLYGSGSLAGTVRYITKKPNTQEFATKAGADFSSTKRGGFNHRLDGMLNVPLSDTLALRVVGYEVFDDGYIRGVGPANTGRDANDVRQYGGRAAVRWKPTDRFTADANVMIQRLRGDMSPQDNIDFAYSRGVPVGPYEQYRDSPAFTNNDFNLYNLTLNYDLGWGELASSTSFVDNENDYASDFTTGVQLFFGVDLASRTLNFASSKDLSQELHITTNFQGPLNFIGGVFYIDQDRRQLLSNPTPGFDAAYTIPHFGVDSTAFGAPVDYILTQAVAIDERQVAFFGELTYEMTKKLSATAGLRWFDVKQDYFISTAGIAASGDPPLNRASRESGFNPKFLVSYAVSDDVLLSAQAARGFRLGGTNELVPALLCAADLAALGLTKAPETFKSEDVWNYELNAKTSWLDRRLTANGSVYDIEYKDIQVLTQIACGFPFTDNAASARSRGVELELKGRPLQGLELAIGGAYTDAKLTVDVPRLGGKAGDQLPMSAKFTGNATARYEFPIGGALDGFLQYSYRYTDQILFSFPEVSPRAGPAPAYGLHNIRLGLKNGRWNASLYVDNVADETVITYESNFFGLERLRTLGQPRTVGLSLSAHF